MRVSLDGLGQAVDGDMTTTGAIASPPGKITSTRGEWS